MGRSSRFSELAGRFLKGLSDDETRDLQEFLEELLRVRASPAGGQDKLQRTTAVVRQAKALWTVLRVFWDVLKQHVWVKPGDSWRRGVAGGAATLAVFGPQGAGIAALGGAVGLPLWIVFGAGAALAKTLIDDINQSRG